MSSPLKQNTTSLQELLEEINSLPTYVDTTSATASASDILSGKTAYVDGKKVTGNIPTNTSSNLTASGATVTVPAGYYSSQAAKSVDTVTQATPSVSIDSAGKITATATQTAGYVSAGTKTGSKQLTTQAAKTVTPSTSEQTAVSSGVYTTGAVKVAAIPSKYVDNSTVTAIEADVLSGKKFGSTNSVKTGSMANNGAVSKTLDGVTTKSVIIPAGYTSGGTVSMDGTVDNAVTAALSALVEKGVEVPEGTNVTGLAALIAAIESGGGNIAYGTITPSSTGSAVTITHNLGAVPTTGIFIKMTNDAASSTSDTYGLFQSSDTGIGIFSYKSSIYLRNANNSLTQATALTYNFNRADANTVKTPTVIIAGKTYFWVLMV